MARKKAESKEAETSSVPTPVADLVARFHEHADAYHAGRYNETQIRREFIDPFFKTLGWDVWNEQSYAEAYKDVIHEDAINVGGATKAPDYCFRIGGVRKFFVEAKKPSVDIKADAGPAFQLRRYAWSAKLPLSILTDFEELAVYDCRVKPVRSDKASTARVLYFRYDEYPQRWDELASVFSREAILKGSFDKYAESSRRKRGTAEVDDAFLAEIEQWRDVLARNLALRNRDLTQRDLNFAVQRTIDRIVFLRICEDRGIEQYGTLQALTNGDKVYERLFERFRRADERYNSGLFHFSKERGRPEEPDDLTPALTIDDKPLKDILARLYYPESPYEFSVLPADILGQVYEQFLGKVIRLTKGHRAVVEEKPEVRKAGGVYYTPTYIVDYIVKHTVGKLLEGKTPQQVGGLTDRFQLSKAKGVRPLAVLDPACGSGSFLLGAYQFLLDWYRDRYLEDGPKTHAAGRNPRLFQHPSGDWRLTTAQRKRILLSHIHGVDIDSQAVETTKLSLLLKVLEGESAQPVGSNLRLFHERALPDLAANIKCGNSLIGPDFYDNQQMAMFDEDERLRINVFDWNAEFKDIMRAGGFDAVIGNPPYIRVTNIQEEIRPYLYDTYNINHRFDMYVVFLHRGFSLLSAHGTLGFIVPNKFTLTDYGASLRADLASQRAVRQIVDFGDYQVFPGATTYTCLLFLSREPQNQVRYQEASTTPTAASFGEDAAVFVRVERLTDAPWVFTSETGAQLLERIEGLPRLGEYCDIQHGLQTGCDDVFVLQLTDTSADDPLTFTSRAEQTPFRIEGAAVRPLLKGAVDVRRYHVDNKGRYVLFPYSTASGTATIIDEPTLKHTYPLAWTYLRRHAGTLRSKRKPGPWYAFRRRNYDLHNNVERLLTPSIAANASFAADLGGAYHFVGSGGGGGGGYGLNLHRGAEIDLRYLLGLLNSRLLDWIVKLRSSRFSGGYYSYNRQYIEDLPIRTCSPHDAPDKSRGQRLVALVQQMLDLHKQLATAKTAYAKTAIQRQIDATDRQIDQLVYELYGLSDDEIAIVEKTTGLQGAR